LPSLHLFALVAHPGAWQMSLWQICDPQSLLVVQEKPSPQNGEQAAQAPPEHTPVEHVVAVPHWPLVPHVCTCTPFAHCVAPGTQTPPHPDATHANWHVVAATHCPFVPHVWSCVSLEHSAAPGEQTPWHDAVPIETMHAWFVQLTAVSHIPFAPHVCTAAFPEHCVAPGVHVPAHVAPPPLIVHAELLHATAVPQAPLALHVDTPFPMHSVAPGTHVPTHAPPTHAEAMHGADAPHAPVMSHVCTPLVAPPSDDVPHCVDPGLHTPWHAAVPTGPPHAWPVQGAGVLHAPLAVHVWNAVSPEHCV